MALYDSARDCQPRRNRDVPHVTKESASMTAARLSQEELAERAARLLTLEQAIAEALGEP